MRRRELIAGATLLAVLALIATGPALARSSIGIGGGEMAPTAPAGGVLGAFFVQVTVWQREFFTALRHALVDLKSSAAALPFLVGLSFVYGVFHAAGPGHGKAVISSYVVANRVQLRRGILLCLASSLIQALSAIAVVGAGWFFLRGSSISMTDAADWVEIASFALVAVFGGWLLARKLAGLVRAYRRRSASRVFDGLPAYDPVEALASRTMPMTMPMMKTRTRTFGSAAPASAFAVSRSAFGDPGAPAAARAPAMRPASSGFEAAICRDGDDACGCGRAHMPDPRTLGGTMTLGSAAAAVFAIGLRPCAGAVVVLTFALVNGLYLGGVLSVLAMALGTAITVSAIACIAVFARNSAQSLGGRGTVGRALMSTLEIGSALFMLVIGLLLLGAALQGL